VSECVHACARVCGCVCACIPAHSDMTILDCSPFNW